jgi:hypothetical protein
MTGISQGGSNTAVAPLLTGSWSVLPSRSVQILIQRDHVDGEMPRRARARIADSAIAAPFARFADCPASAGVPCRSGSGFPPRGFAGIDIGEVDDRRTISRKQAPATN